ncbi:MAG: hypothetical protein WDW38_011238 [Sanguina aurantia]
MHAPVSFTFPDTRSPVSAGSSSSSSSSGSGGSSSDPSPADNSHGHTSLQGSHPSTSDRDATHNNSSTPTPNPTCVTSAGTSVSQLLLGSFPHQPPISSRNSLPLAHHLHPLIRLPIRRSLASWRPDPFSSSSIQNRMAEMFSGWGRQFTNAMLASNIAVYLATRLDHRLLMRMVQVPGLVSNGEYYRLLTAAFTHDGILHLLGNLLAIHYLTPPVESECGAQRTAVIYLTAAVAGGMMQHMMGNPFQIVLGASGGIAGMFGALVMYKVRNRNHIPFTSNDTNWIFQMVGLNIVLSMLMGGSIAHWGHLGGLLGGAASMWLFGPRYVWRNGGREDRPLLPWFKP